MGRVETGSAPEGWRPRRSGAAEEQCPSPLPQIHGTPSSTCAHRLTLPSSYLILRLGLRPTNASTGRDDPIICLHIHSSRILGYTTAAVPRSHPHDCVSLGKLWACRHSPTCSPVATRSHLPAYRLGGGSYRFTGKHLGASAESSHQFTRSQGKTSSCVLAHFVQESSPQAHRHSGTLEPISTHRLLLLSL